MEHVKISLETNLEQLEMINQFMEVLDSINFQSQPQHLKSSLSACTDLREKLMIKAIKLRDKTGKFNIKMPYYFADSLFRYLNAYTEQIQNKVQNPYQENVLRMLLAQLHQKLL